ncbi:hypothetical protein [Intrasporangium sp. DVR]|uniref:hypothetical protein n=1 Tax=Intrasporangium sp. DVR TaxID=3127867 RepID=UPI00313A511D
MQRYGFRSWRGSGQAVRWTLTAPAGWSFLATRLGAVTTAGWVQSQYGETPAVVTLVLAIVVAGLVAPHPPDTVDDEHDPHRRVPTAT